MDKYDPDLPFPSFADYKHVTS